MSEHESDAEREEKRARKRHEEDHRVPDSWERYRVLCDGIDLKRRLIDLGDHKVRFALVIAGALNTVLFLLALRGLGSDAFPPLLLPWLSSFLGLYLALTVAFFLQAIAALQVSVELRERSFLESGAEGQVGRHAEQERPLGLFVPGATLHHTRDEYRQLWNTARLSQINAELVAISYGLSDVVHRQYLGLQRLFVGLKVLTLLAAALMAIVAHFVLRVSTLT